MPACGCRCWGSAVRCGWWPGVRWEGSISRAPVVKQPPRPIPRRHPVLPAAPTVRRVRRLDARGLRGPEARATRRVCVRGVPGGARRGRSHPGLRRHAGGLPHTYLASMARGVGWGPAGQATVGWHACVSVLSCLLCLLCLLQARRDPAAHPPWSPQACAVRGPAPAWCRCAGLGARMLPCAACAAAAAVLLLCCRCPPRSPRPCSCFSHPP